MRLESLISPMRNPFAGVPIFISFHSRYLIAAFQVAE